MKKSNIFNLTIILNIILLAISFIISIIGIIIFIWNGSHKIVFISGGIIFLSSFAMNLIFKNSNPVNNFISYIYFPSFVIGLFIMLFALFTTLFNGDITQLDKLLGIGVVLYFGVPVASIMIDEAV